MVETLPVQGVISVVPEAVLAAHIQKEDERKAALAAGEPTRADTNLAGYIKRQFEMFQRHRTDAVAGWNERLLHALRTFNGKYDAAKLAEIKKFGGSDVYARLVAVKCRGATSLLRDIYLGTDRPWGIAPPADPDVPSTQLDAIKQLVMAEVQTMMAAGQQPTEEMVRDRIMSLLDAAKDAARRQAKKRAKQAEDKIEELLDDGNFYTAFSEFLVDISLFPFAVLKGPVVKVMPTVSWVTGQPVPEQRPRLMWVRVSPFDLYWTPGVSDIADAAVIERTRLTRAEINDLLDLPGYNVEAVRAVLDEYGAGGLAENWDTTDTERAVYESRENPQTNESGIINCLEFHGNVQGRMLLDGGMDPELIPDPLRDYMVQAWVIGRHVIKVQLSPSPRKRHPYFITSFEKVPGTPVGNALPDILSDIQDVANAVLRSLVNNLAMSSGPQVVVNDDRLAPGEDGDTIFPWKRWHSTSDPMGNNAQAPITFFQPQSNAQELLAVYKEFVGIADEISAIPRYLQGQNAGGAGRTASGLAMLMGNASKVLQMVAANIDRDVLSPLLSQLYDMLMLTDTSGILQGDELIRVMGVVVAIQRETQRARQLEFLQITANPLDAQIMGVGGRAKVLRAVSEGIGLDGEGIVPSEDQLNQQVQAQAAMAQAGAEAQGGQQGGQVTGDMGPRTNIAGGVQ